MQRLFASCDVLHLPQLLDRLTVVLLISLAMVFDPECLEVLGDCATCMRLHVYPHEQWQF